MLRQRDIRRQLIEVSQFLAPSALRHLLRSNELGFLGIAALVGTISGVAVTGMGRVAQLLHQNIFGLVKGQWLSSVGDISLFKLLLGPVSGGIIMGLLFLAGSRAQQRRAVDPIEANALYGGRMSLGESLRVAFHNLISNGFGASVGLEAGYTQLSCGIASRVGLALKMRRNDLRTLVGCGAAAAIATAFGAPLTGALYAFELIIGTYSIATLAPVVVAALCGTFASQLLVGSSSLVELADFGKVTNADYFLAILLGIICSGIGILIMHAVVLVERFAAKSQLPGAIQPIIGGLAVGLLALVSPQVLSAGHGAFHLNLATTSTALSLLTLLLLKSVASALSIGLGFRGGLFFASLFLGSLTGKLFAIFVPELLHTATLTPAVYAIIGMSSLSVGIVGGPLTMTFLALELTGDFTITTLVLTAVIASSVTVRKLFGYSFAIWRFHLRGENIRSAHDVGWIRDLTVDKLMRHDVKTIGNDASLAVFRREFPLGSAQRVIVVDDANRYVGIILVPEAHTAAIDELDQSPPLQGLLRYQADVFLPQMNIFEATKVFEQTESEALAVVDAPKTRKVIGLLTESHTLRRYREELDLRLKEISGRS